MYIAQLPRLLQPFYCADLVRLGKDHDGGYLINSQDVNASQCLLSFGIGSDCSFEQDFVAINDCPVDSYDASVPPSEFFVGQRRHHQQNVEQLPDILPGTFLKCDIEGSEYQLLNDIINASDKFTGMAFEFHEINRPENFDALTNFVSKVRQRLVHVHVNNYFYYKDGDRCIPDILEMTFSSSENVVYKPWLTLPHQLDQTNNPNDQEFELRFPNA